MGVPAMQRERNILYIGGRKRSYLGVDERDMKREKFEAGGVFLNQLHGRL